MLLIIGVLIVSFLVSLLLIPFLINFASKNDFLAKGGGRKIHKGFTPYLGGVAIFSGFILSNFIFLFFYHIDQSFFWDEAYILKVSFSLLFYSSLILVFLLGLFDDVFTLSLKFRFFIQFFLAFILSYLLDVRVESFYGLFGVYDLSYFQSIFFSIIVIIFIINSFNFIDGLDILAASQGIFILSTFTLLFLLNDLVVDAIISLCAIFSLLPFLFYNRYPAKIFMGDSGSYFLGFLISYCAIKLCNYKVNFSGTINPVLILCILSYPSIDTLRVFLLRILSGKSPFYPDQNHLHHKLANVFSHEKSSLIIFSFSIIVSFLCFVFVNSINYSFCFIILFIVFLITSFFRYFKV